MSHIVSSGVKTQVAMSGSTASAITCWVRDSMAPPWSPFVLSWKEKHIDELKVSHGGTVRSYKCFPLCQPEFVVSPTLEELTTVYIDFLNGLLAVDFN